MCKGMLMSAMLSSCVEAVRTAAELEHASSETWMCCSS